MNPEHLKAGLNWGASKGPESRTLPYKKEDRVAFINPVYVVPEGAAETARARFETYSMN